MKNAPFVVGAALVVTLAACGGGGDGGANSSYCKDIKSAAKTFGTVSGGDAAQLESAFATFHKLAAESPGTIKADWAKLDNAITTVESALKDAGIKLSDFPQIQKGQIPAGVDRSKLTGLASTFSKLNNADFTKASKNIETHAKKTCKVDLAAS